MEELDRPGWTAGFTARSYGVRIGVRATEPEVLERMFELLPPSSTAGGSAVVDRLYSVVVGGPGPQRGMPRHPLLYVGSQRICRSRVLGDVLDPFEPRSAWDVALSAPRRLFVHAGVVGWHGAAIVLPGASGSGKSELVRA